MRPETRFMCVGPWEHILYVGIGMYVGDQIEKYVEATTRVNPSRACMLFLITSSTCS